MNSLADSPKIIYIGSYGRSGSALPEPMLGTQLGEFLGIDMPMIADTALSKQSIDLSHCVSGNRMRRSGPVILKSNVEWQSFLPKVARLLTVLAFPPVYNGHCPRIWCEHIYRRLLYVWCSDDLITSQR